MISIDSFHDGGAEMFAIRLANGLSDNYEVHFMEYRAGASNVKAQKAQLNSKVKIFSPEESIYYRIISKFNRITRGQYSRIISSTLSYCRYICIQKYIEKNKISTVNSHAIECNNVLTRIKKHNPTLKLVLSLHGHYELYRNNYDVTKFRTLITNHIVGFDNIIYTTLDQLNTFIEFGLDTSRAKRIFYGLVFETSKASHKPFKAGDILNLILVSRAIPEKGWKEAILAVISLNENNVKVNLELVGDGPLLSELKSKNYPDFIRFAGNVDNVLPLIEDAHIGLLPTYYYAESLPNSVIEYLSCGKPVVASNIGAIEDMLSYNNEIAGVLISNQRGNPVKVDELKTSIEKFATNPQLYNLYSTLAFGASEKFNMSACLSDYSSLL